MASMKYHKDCRRWRVCWHVTLPNREVDRGSKSFKDKALARKFKKHCEKRAKQLKRAIFVEDSLLEDAVVEWEGFCQGYTDSTEKHYIAEAGKFVAALPENVVYISDLKKLHIQGLFVCAWCQKLIRKSVYRGSGGSCTAFVSRM